VATWSITPDKVLTKQEIHSVVADLRRRARRSTNSKMNLALFRLACCCGLRVSELTGLILDDLRVDCGRPSIRVRKAIAKGHKPRTVPLTFDAATLADLREWKMFRVNQGARGDDWVICSQSKPSVGRQIDRRNARKRFKAACRALGGERVATLTIHHGRHSFITHCLYAGRNVIEVQAAAGHSSLNTTTRYAHVLLDDGSIGNVFGD
jgi:integrase